MSWRRRAERIYRDHRRTSQDHRAHPHARARARDRARGRRRGAAARPGQRKGGRPGGGRRHATRAQPAPDRRHCGDRRRRDGRGADALHRRAGRQRGRARGRIAVDPLEGTTLCAKDMPGAIAVMAMAEAGTLLAAPDVYMKKIAIGPGYPPARRPRRPAGENILGLAKAKGVKPAEITALILDRPRHAGPHRRRAQDRCRRPPHLGRRHRRGHLHDQPDETGIDIYLGIGGRRRACSRRARCAASAARCRAV